MRVVVPARGSRGRTAGPRARRAARLEALGLAVVTVVVVFGLALAYLGKVEGAPGVSTRAEVAALDLRRLTGPDQVAPLLATFESPFERRAVAEALYRRATDESHPLQHVGALAGAAIPAAEIRRDRRYVRLRERLDGRPASDAVPVLTSGELGALKPHVVVRTPAEFRWQVVAGVVWLVTGFWAAHVIRRVRATLGDPVLLPAAMLLCGIGLMSLLALRDPLRDTLPFAASVTGIAAGLALLVAASEVDLEASPLRRSVLGPLAGAVGVAALLWLFGTGPGGTGTRLHLFWFQPADFIRLLVVCALAAHFARRGDFLREYSESPAALHHWLEGVRLPRWKDVGPALVSVGVVIAFFFLQRDLGPALVLACVFLGMYGVARSRGVLVAGGLIAVLCAFALAYWTGVPGTVRQRVAIWVDPWMNGVTGGNQVAHGFWALATGAAWGTGLGRGSGSVVPAGDTDFILALVGEDLGFAGLAAIVALYALLGWRCLRIALRAPGDFTALLAIGVALTLVVQGAVIASGVLGLLPLSGVVTPFLSYGRSAMVANFLALGIVLAISRRQGPVRPHLQPAVRAVGMALAVAGSAVLARAGWIQLVHADAVATGATLTEQADGGTRFEYNPRLVAAGRLIERGSIYDRRGLPLASSNAQEIAAIPATYRAAGLAASPCAPGERCYPLGPAAFHVLGDWTSQVNWGAPNSSYVERDRDVRLKGFDDRPRLVETVNRRSGTRTRSTVRDYRELLPLARDRFERRPAAVRALLARDRSIHLTLDARLQARAAAALRRRIEAGGHARGAAAIVDVESGDVLASVSEPQPLSSAATRRAGSASGAPAASASEALLDRARYGLYPPGSTFKVLVAAAAMRSGAAGGRTFACIRLPDGRVGNYVRGWRRPVRDDRLDHTPHGHVDLRTGLVVSCNAYFAQLALATGPRPILEAASLFGIEVARPATPARVRELIPHAGYGQGEVLVSPLKMARVAAAIAHDGNVVPPRDVGQGFSPGQTASANVGHGFSPARIAASPAQRLLDPAQARELGRHLRAAVTSGTGRAVAANPTPIAGKTGTAEVEDAPSHSWFAGYAPYGSDRQIAFAVVVENAGYGARAAAPIAGELVTAARELGLIR